MKDTIGINVLGKIKNKSYIYKSNSITTILNLKKYEKFVRKIIRK